MSFLFCLWALGLLDYSSQAPGIVEVQEAERLVWVRGGVWCVRVDEVVMFISDQCEYESRVMMLGWWFIHYCLWLNCIWV